MIKTIAELPGRLWRLFGEVRTQLRYRSYTTKMTGLMLKDPRNNVILEIPGKADPKTNTFTSQIDEKSWAIDQEFLMVPKQRRVVFIDPKIGFTVNPWESSKDLSKRIIAEWPSALYFVHRANLFRNFSSLGDKERASYILIGFLIGFTVGFTLWGMYAIG